MMEYLIDLETDLPPHVHICCAWCDHSEKIHCDIIGILDNAEIVDSMGISLVEFAKAGWRAWGITESEPIRLELAREARRGDSRWDNGDPRTKPFLVWTKELDGFRCSCMDDPEFNKKGS